MISPDQLDMTIRVTGPLYWTSLAGILAGLIAAAVWSFTGSIPTKAMGEGVIIRPGGLFSIFSPAAGFVKSVDVRAGDRVRANQTVAEIDQPTSDQDIEALQDRLAEVRDQNSHALALRQDTARLQQKNLDAQRQNAQREIAQQQKLQKIAEDELGTTQRLYDKGLITRQVVVDAQQKLMAIESSIGRLQAELLQTDTQAFQAKWQPEEQKKQNDLQIHDLEAQLKGLRTRSRLTSTVVSPVNGQVVEERIYAGALIASGTPMLSIEPDGEEMTAVIYVPSALAKEIKTGMDAEISPSTAKREEYGFIRGKVTFVSDYPATTGGMMALLENDTLVSSLRGRGMVSEVHLSLARSASTPTGFVWSSSRGPDADLTPGTLCTVEVVTRSQRPIELVLPFLKRITGLH